MSMTTKELAVKAIKDLPGDATMSDIQYRLYVIGKIQKSKDSVSRHGTVSHSDVKKSVSKWLTK